MQVLSAPLRALLFCLDFVFGIAAWIKSCLTLFLQKLVGVAKGKTSYLAKTDQLLCTSEVESVGQDDAGKT